MINKDLNNDSLQLPLGFSVANYMRREDFMVSDCNREAFNMIECWPNWLTSGLIIYGPSGCGKSHLAHLFADKVKQAASKAIKVSFFEAQRINLHNLRHIAEENQSLVIENLSPKANQEALFHLFNIYNETGRYILWTADMAPSRMHFALADLQSRLNMLPSIAISEPDDKMLQMLIAKLFDDRQIIISQEILNYIVANTQRSFAYIQRLVEEIDYISLSRQTAVNYAVVKAAMDNLSRIDDNEPDLFDDY